MLLQFAFFVVADIEQCIHSNKDGADEADERFFSFVRIFLL